MQFGTIVTLLWSTIALVVYVLWLGFDAIWHRLIKRTRMPHRHIEYVQMSIVWPLVIVAVVFLWINKLFE